MGYRLTILFFVILVLGCNKVDNNFERGETVTISINKSVNLKNIGLSIEFTKLIEESRCQPNTECFWEGRALVELTLNQKTKVILGIGNLKASSTQNYYNSTYYNGFNIELKEVNYGAERNYGKSRKYQVNIMID